MCIALIVDDDPTQQLIISKLLKRIGLDVVVASDGREALSLVGLLNPVLIILDVIMPQMNGYEVCYQLKADEKTRHLPIVMYSGQDKEFSFSIENLPCADAYVSKICQHQELIDTVNQFLSPLVN